jgi:transcriptional regulator with XRE-family HTH domain
MTFGASLRRHRHTARLTHRELATRAGLSPRQLHRYMSGQSEPTLTTLLTLADALAVEPAALLLPSARQLEDTKRRAEEQRERARRLDETLCLLEAVAQGHTLPLRDGYSGDSPRRAGLIP